MPEEKNVIDPVDFCNRAEKEYGKDMGRMMRLGLLYSYPHRHPLEALEGIKAEVTDHGNPVEDPAYKMLKDFQKFCEEVPQ